MTPTAGNLQCHPHVLSNPCTCSQPQDQVWELGQLVMLACLALSPGGPRQTRLSSFLATLTSASPRPTGLDVLFDTSPMLSRERLLLLNCSVFLGSSSAMSCLPLLFGFPDDSSESLPSLGCLPEGKDGSPSLFPRVLESEVYTGVPATTWRVHRRRRGVAWAHPDQTRRV